MDLGPWPSIRIQVELGPWHWRWRPRFDFVLSIVVLIASFLAPVGTVDPAKVPASAPESHSPALRAISEPPVGVAPVEISAQGPIYNDWSCGITGLPPCGVLDRENPMRDLAVYNCGTHYPPGYTGGNGACSTASGKWQFLRSTWNMHGGYLNAADAPVEVQDEKARQLWAGGRGCGHWSWCGRR